MNRKAPQPLETATEGKNPSIEVQKKQVRIIRPAPPPAPPVPSVPKPTNKK